MKYEKVNVVKVLHQEVGVAVNAYLGKFHQRGVASVAIDAFNELAAHLQAHAPVLVAEVLAGRLGYVVAEIQ